MCQLRVLIGLPSTNEFSNDSNDGKNRGYSLNRRATVLHMTISFINRRLKDKKAKLIGKENGFTTQTDELS